MNWVRTVMLRDAAISLQLMGVRDHQGRTPLWWAITSSKILLSKTLSEVVDEVEVLDKQGNPPLIASTSGQHVRNVVQMLLEHVSQFDSDGERLESHSSMTERAISYVRSFLEFNQINTNRTFYGELRDVWLSIKPGDPMPQLISEELPPGLQTLV